MTTRSLQTVLALSLLASLTGCGSAGLTLDDSSSRSDRDSSIRTSQTSTSRSAQSPSSARSGDAVRAITALRETVDSWMGVPYKWGGDDRNGVDCSAFVQTMYSTALGVSIPRTTTLQKRVGRSVSKDQLLPSDLVFFYTPKRTNHVGVYLGSGRFAHASTSRGVMVSTLSERYWRDAYTGARRITDLDAASAVQTPTESPGAVQETLPRASTPTKARPSTTRKRRTGW